MFHRINNNEIQESLHNLPKDYKVNGVLHPLRQLWKLGHMNDVIGLGWVPEEKETVEYNPETHFIEGYSYIVSYNKVVATPIIKEKSPTE